VARRTISEESLVPPRATLTKCAVYGGSQNGAFSVLERDQFPRDDASAFTTKAGDQCRPDLTGGGFRRHALIVPDSGGGGVMLPLLAPGEREAVAGEGDASGAVHGISSVHCKYTTAVMERQENRGRIVENAVVVRVSDTQHYHRTTLALLLHRYALRVSSAI
tara:strand:- start:3972 stop:4460 length:489 start_codon:yes stop_codon:yes gene_type:complete